jgi:hypothetical protein
MNNGIAIQLSTTQTETDQKGIICPSSEKEATTKPTVQTLDELNVLKWVENNVKYLHAKLFQKALFSSETTSSYHTMRNGKWSRSMLEKLGEVINADPT